MVVYISLNPQTFLTYSLAANVLDLLIIKA